jgi:hypothetical protein
MGKAERIFPFRFGERSFKNESRYLESLVLVSKPLHRLPMEAESGQQPVFAPGPKLQADLGDVRRLTRSQASGLF